MTFKLIVVAVVIVVVIVITRNMSLTEACETIFSISKSVDARSETGK